MSRNSFPRRRHFYDDCLDAVGPRWERHTVIAERMREVGWNPTPHDLKRMLHLIAKHGKIWYRTNSNGMVTVRKSEEQVELNPPNNLR